MPIYSLLPRSIISRRGNQYYLPIHGKSYDLQGDWKSGNSLLDIQGVTFKNLFHFFIPSLLDWNRRKALQILFQFSQNLIYYFPFQIGGNWKWSWCSTLVESPCMNAKGENAAILSSGYLAGSTSGRSVAGTASTRISHLSERSSKALLRGLMNPYFATSGRRELEISSVARLSNGGLFGDTRNHLPTLWLRYLDGNRWKR